MNESPGLGRRAFTLLELIVVVAIVGLLAGLLLPVLGRSRARARDAYCLNNLRQLGLAVAAYAQDYGSHLPVAERMPTTPADPAHPLPRIRDLLGSYVESKALVFQCPNDAGNYFGQEGSSYEWNYTFNGTLIDRPGFWVLSIPPETAPLMYDYDNVHLGADTNGTKNVIFADGHAAPL